jgi:hypothetical protein
MPILIDGKETSIEDAIAQLYTNYEVIAKELQELRDDLDGLTGNLDGLELTLHGWDDGLENEEEFTCINRTLDDLEDRITAVEDILQGED